MQALKTDDRTILNWPCQKIVEAFNTVFKDEEGIPQHEDCQGLAEYLETRTVSQLPEGFETRMTRILPDGRLDLTGFRRKFRKDEMGLYDGNTGRWLCSLYCGQPPLDAVPFYITKTKEGATSKPIQDSADRAGQDTSRLSRQQNSSNLPLWHWGRNTGKLLWVGVPVAALLSAFFAHEFWEDDEVVNTNENNNRFR